MDLEHFKNRLEQVEQALKQLENNYNVAIGQRGELQLIIQQLEKLKAEGPGDPSKPEDPPVQEPAPVVE